MRINKKSERSYNPPRTKHALNDSNGLQDGPAPRPVRALRTDGEATYNRILEAAGELFGSTGYAETTNKMIAASADVDLASINYHFGNRSGLYQAVLAEAHGRLIDVNDLKRVDALPIPPEEKLRHLITFLVNSGVDGGKWPAKVLGRELLSPSSHFATFQQTEILPKISILLRILSEITHLPPDDPALLRCLISVAAPCAMLLMFRKTASPLAERLIVMPRETIIEHLHSFAIGGLETISRQNKASTDT